MSVPVAETSSGSSTPSTQSASPPAPAPHLAPEKKFSLRGSLSIGPMEPDSALNRQNPDTVVNNFDAPNFRALSGGQSRAVTIRVRFIGRK